MSVRRGPLLALALSVVMSAARQADGESVDAEAPDASSCHARHRCLSDAVCGGKHVCGIIWHSGSTIASGAEIAVDTCEAHGQSALFYGGWIIRDPGGFLFEWEAEVRYGGLLPSLGQVIMNLGCGVAESVSPWLTALVAYDPEGFNHLRLRDDDVFIPIGGKASIDKSAHATAMIDPKEGCGRPRAKVSIEVPRGPPLVYDNLRRGDSFVWGSHWVTVVHIVPPFMGFVGEIGWVEIKVSDGPLPHHH